jgi:hypothetical protein
MWRRTVTTGVSLSVTSVGPVTPELRDRLAEYRDEQGHPNYNAALRDLLDAAEEDVSGVTLKGESRGQ